MPKANCLHSAPLTNTAIASTESLGWKVEADRLFNLEPLICDLDLTIDVLFELCRDKMSLTGDVVFSEQESSRIYFMLCNTQRASRELKAYYYGEEAA